MSHKKSRSVYQHGFNLSSDEPDQQRLHDHLVKLAQSDEKSAWIIKVLIAALPSKPSGSRVEVKQLKALPRQGDDLTYEDID